MIEIRCKNCGSTELREQNGYQICEYCGAKFLVNEEDKLNKKETVVNLKADVKMLLAKCNEEPERAAQIAKRILEIDQNNPEAIEILRKNNSRNGCYIATAVYGSYDCPEVWTLRRFRDNYLSKSWCGRAFIHIYYATSPKLVKRFGENCFIKGFCKKTLDTFVAILNKRGISNAFYED